MFVILNEVFLNLFDFANVKHHGKTSIILIFWPKFVEQVYFHFRTEQTNIINEFNKFHFNQRIWLFWTKFANKEYLWFKRENLNITIEFRIFELF